MRGWRPGIPVQVFFTKAYLGFSTTNVLSVGSKSSLKVGGGQKAVLVGVHDAKGFLELLDGGMGEGFKDVGFLRHLEGGVGLVGT